MKRDESASTKPGHDFVVAFSRALRWGDDLDGNIRGARYGNSVGIQTTGLVAKQNADIRPHAVFVGEGEFDILVGQRRNPAGIEIASDGQQYSEHDILMPRCGTAHRDQFSIKQLPSTAFVVGHRVELRAGDGGDGRHGGNESYTITASVSSLAVK